MWVSFFVKSVHGLPISVSEDLPKIINEDKYSSTAIDVRLLAYLFSLETVDYFDNKLHKCWQRKGELIYSTNALP